MVRVTVPATSANMGSGYDSIGIALEMYNVIDLAENDHIDISDKNGQFVPKDESNLIYQCAKRVYDECGKPLSGLTIVEDCAIPQTRGLGSSSACTVAGIMGANALLGEPLDRNAVIDLAATIEGHPDNSTPAILGGFCVALLENCRSTARSTSWSLSRTSSFPPKRRVRRSRSASTTTTRSTTSRVQLCSRAA